MTKRSKCEGCGKPVPVEGDPYCSRVCCEKAHGLKSAEAKSSGQKPRARSAA